MGPNPMTDTLARREDTAAQKHTGECHVNIKGDISISHGMQKIASKAPEAGSGA